MCICICIFWIRSYFCPVKFHLAGICWICVIMDADGLTSQVICISTASSKVSWVCTVWSIFTRVNTFVNRLNILWNTFVIHLKIHLYQLNLIQGALTSVTPGQSVFVVGFYSVDYICSPLSNVPNMLALTSLWWHLVWTVRCISSYIHLLDNRIRSFFTWWLFHLN